LMLMFPMEKIMALWVISKTMGHLHWKKMFSWTCGRAREVRFVLSAESWKMRKSIRNNKKRKKIPPLWSLSFLAINDLITKLTLHNMPFLKTWSSIHYKRLLSIVLCWKSMVKAHDFKTIFTYCVSISTSIGDKCVTQNCVKNQGEIWSTLTCFLCYMHGIFWSLNVSWWTWHLCHGC
jgi:hypothetical protein